jgi:gliding motility-associated-like protein
VALSLKVLPTDETIFTDTVVVGESYENADFSLPAQTELGWHSYYKHLQNSEACDSLLTLNLLVVGDEDVVDVPTAFTPQNQNGVNDVFMKGYEIYIYDRYGLLVCHSNDGWDGTYRGEIADAGVYIYKLIFKSGKEKSGTVEIFKE